MQQLQLQPRQPPAAASNKVYTGDVTLNDAAGIARFAPLLRGATKIEGNVSIGHNPAGVDPGSPITEAQLADMFGAVREITGWLALGKCTCPSVEGLGALATIGGYLSISSNPSLASVEGLRALTTVGGYLCIYSNARLASVEGLRALTTIGGNLSISSNTSLASVEGLHALTTIGGYLNIANNASLASVEGLCNLKYIRGSDSEGDAIFLLDNPNLARGLPFPALLCKNGTVFRDVLRHDSINAYVDSHLAALARVPYTC